ncbi:hypothetical protein DNTS_022729 [Danionella cerebrum]|uniref:Centrosomal protein of 164 kDa n=1 Tax=Danionella cerebrum TaxID=2873325 RepID=A0A553MY22_9TELE|nr:hypothetical protein DNTS_022729 [Danionella translucida]
MATTALRIGDQVVLEEDYDENYIPSEQEIQEYALEIGIDPQKEPELMWLAREGMVAPLPAEWKPCQDVTGEIYYFNFSTGQSTWDHPCDEHYRQLVALERERRSTADAGQTGKKEKKKAKKKKERKKKKETDGGRLPGLLAPLGPLRGLSAEPPLRTPLGLPSGHPPLMAASSVAPLKNVLEKKSSEEEEISEEEEVAGGARLLLQNLHLDLDALGAGLHYEVDSEHSETGPPEERTEPELQELDSREQSVDLPSEGSFSGRHVHSSALDGQIREEEEEGESEKMEGCHSLEEKEDGTMSERAQKRTTYGMIRKEEEDEESEQIEETEEGCSSPKGKEGKEESRQIRHEEEEKGESDGQMEIFNSHEEKNEQESVEKEETEQVEEEIDEQMERFENSERNEIEEKEENGQIEELSDEQIEVFKNSEEKKELIKKRKEGEEKEETEQIEEEGDQIERFKNSVETKQRNEREEKEEIEQIEEKSDEQITRFKNSEEKKDLTEERNEDEKEETEQIEEESDEQMEGFENSVEIKERNKADEKEETEQIEEESDEQMEGFRKSVEIKERNEADEKEETEQIEEESDEQMEGFENSEEIKERNKADEKEETEQIEEESDEQMEGFKNSEEIKERNEADEKEETEQIEEESDEQVERFSNPEDKNRAEEEERDTLEDKERNKGKKEKTMKTATEESSEYKLLKMEREGEQSDIGEEQEDEQTEEKNLQSPAEFHNKSHLNLTKGGKFVPQWNPVCSEESEAGEASGAMPLSSIDQWQTGFRSRFSENVFDLLELASAQDRKEEVDVSELQTSESINRSRDLKKQQLEEEKEILRREMEESKRKEEDARWKIEEVERKNMEILTEKKRKEEEEVKKRKEEEEKKRKEMEEKKKMEEEEKKRKDIEDKKRQEEEKKKEIEEKKRKEAEQKRRKEEEEKKNRQALEEEKRKRLEEERLVDERKRQIEENKKRMEEEEKKQMEESAKQLRVLKEEILRRRQEEEERLKEEMELHLREIRREKELMLEAELQRVESRDERLERLKDESEAECKENSRLLQVNSLSSNRRPVKASDTLRSLRPEQPLVEYQRELTEVLQEVREEVEREHRRKLQQLKEEHQQELQSLRDSHLLQESRERERLLNSLKDEREALLSKHTTQLHTLQNTLDTQLQEMRHTNTQKEEELQQRMVELEKRSRVFQNQEEELCLKERDALLQELQQLRADLHTEKHKRETLPAENAHSQQMEEKISVLQHQCEELRATVSELQNQSSRANPSQEVAAEKQENLESLGLKLRLEDLEAPERSTGDSSDSTDRVRKCVWSESVSLHRAQQFLERQSMCVPPRPATHCNNTLHQMSVFQVSCDDGERSADRKVTFDVTESEVSSVYSPEGTVKQLADSLQLISGQLGSVLGALTSLTRTQAQHSTAQIPPTTTQPITPLLPQPQWVWNSGPAPSMLNGFRDSESGRSFWSTDTTRAHPAFPGYTPPSLRPIQEEGQRLQALIEGNKHWLVTQRRKNTSPHSNVAGGGLIQLALDDHNQIKVHHY